MGALASRKVRVRLKLLALWAEGALPDVSRGDLRLIMGPSHFDLRLLAATRSAQIAIRAVPLDAAGASAGRALFEHACASCHGPDARGRAGPDLVGRPLEHGRTDWQLYQTIARGIPQTPMVPTRLTRMQAWTVVAYLRDLQAQRLTADTATPAIPADLPVDTRTFLETGNPGGRNWLTYSGDYTGQRYARLSDITGRTIDRLRVEWLYQLPDATDHNETTPLVVGSVMIVTDRENVWALDVDTGRLLWRYHRALPSDLKLCCGLINRGAAVWGSRVFVGTLDAHLIALNITTGRPVWDVVVDDAAHAVSVTGAPLAVDGKLIVGIGGGDYGVRGHLDAYDAATGARVWRFWTIPDSSDAAAATWPREALARGGGPTWLTGSYDPATQTLYWGVGNPGAAYNAEYRRGANLYTNSMIALDARTGALKWSYQFSPNDSHDWDAAQVPVLIDRLGGRPGKLLLWANRNGFFYVLDRDHSRFVHASAFTRQTWNAGFDSAGRPVVLRTSEATPEGVTVYPSDDGATNWWSPSFDPVHELFFIGVRDGGDIFIREPVLERDDGLYMGGRSEAIPGEVKHFSIVALDASTGATRWRAPLPELTAPAMGGLLATSGNLVFGGHNDILYALDSRTGAHRWQMRLGGDIVAAPISFERPGGQRVAIVAGRVVMVLGLAPVTAPAQIARRAPRPPRPPPSG